MVRPMAEKDTITKVFMLLVPMIVLLVIAGNFLDKDFQIGTILFIIVITGVMFLIYKMVATVGPEKTLAKDDWVVVGISLVILIALLIIFRRLIPIQFLGAVENIASMVGVAP